MSGEESTEPGEIFGEASMEPGEMSGEENMEAEEMFEEESVETEKETGEKEQPEKERRVEFLENPLPLPKKHEKRVMDYKLDSDKDLGGYDIYVAEDDDFDH